MALCALAAAAAASSEATWSVFRPEGGLFRVELPGKPEVKRNSRATPAGPSVMTKYVIQHGDLELAAETHDIPPLGAALMPASVILDQAADGVLEVKRGIPLEMREIRVQGAPAREFSYRVPNEPPLYGLARTILVGSRVFLLTATSPREPGTRPEIERFFASFRFFRDDSAQPGS